MVLFETNNRVALHSVGWNAALYIRLFATFVGWILASGSLASAQGTTPIRLGHYGSMSGSKAAFGTSTDQGIRLAIAEANRGGGVLGRSIEVFTEDDQSNPDQVLPSLLALIDRRKVDVVLGEVSSTLTLIGAPLCQDRGMPMVTPSSTAASITKKGDYIFRVCFIDVYQGRAAAIFSRRDLRATRAAILVDQSNDYSLGFAREYRKLFEKLGGRVVAERTYREGDRDFKPQLAAMRDADPDVIAVPAMYNDVPLITRQARALGIRAAFVGGDGWDAIETAKYGGAAVEGAYFITHYAPDQPAARVQAFQRAFQSEFGAQPPDGIAALGYDAARIVIDAIRRAGSTDARAVRDALAKTRSFPGVTGTITMESDRNPSKSAMVIQIRSGVFHLFRTVEPEDVDRALALSPATQAIVRAPTISSTFLLQQLANGISLGAIYGLIAIGYTIVYGILRLINFAHGDLFMLSPVLVILLAVILGIGALPTGPLAALATLALVMVGCGAAGFALERVAYRPLRRPYSWRGIAVPLALGVVLFVITASGWPPLSGRTANIGHAAAIGIVLYGLALVLNRAAWSLRIPAPDRLVPLITAIGASLFLEYGTQQPALFGNRPRGFPTALVAGILGGHGRPGELPEPLHLGGLVIDRIDILVLAVTIVLVIALSFVVRHTRLGLAMRAVSGNPESSVLMGVDINRVISFSFVLGGSLAGAAGLMWSMKYPTVDAMMGVMPGLKAFVAAVLGGIGSLPGAVLGGLLMGVSEAFLASSALSEYKDALAFGLLIAVLLIRPAGLLGRNLPDKV